MHPAAGRPGARAAGPDEGPGAPRPADVARVDAQRGDAGAERGQGQTVVKVDVGDEREATLGAKGPERLGGLRVGHGHAEDVAAQLGGTVDLAEDGGDVRGGDVGHRLDGDGRPAADGDGADLEPAGLRSGGPGVTPR